MSFVVDIIMEHELPIIEYPGFKEQFVVHRRCHEILKRIKGKPWQSLPPGPLREQIREQHHRQKLADSGKVN